VAGSDSGRAQSNCASWAVGSGAGVAGVADAGPADGVADGLDGALAEGVAWLADAVAEALWEVPDDDVSVGWAVPPVQAAKAATRIAASPTIRAERMVLIVRTP